MKTSSPVETRFWKYVTKTDGCWLWTGATTNGGYGVLQAGGRAGKIVRAHRLSWRLHCGPVADDIDVCHHCDNPPCVRPDHLFLGTAKTNVADMVSKGRARGGSGRGEQHHRAKLTAEQVRAMRADYARGGTSLNQLAAHYGVSKKSVLNIIHRRVWAHV